MGTRRHRSQRWAAYVTIGLGVLSACSLDRGDTDNTDANLGSTTTETATTTTEVEARLFYTVARGDTLVGIANKFDIDLNALVSENGIADPTRIYVGQQLLIPPPADEDEGPQLTIAPPTNPDLPPILPTITFPATTQPSGPQPSAGEPSAE